MDADGFAQGFPERKYRIVVTLRNRGHIVSMTADGENDAPPASFGRRSAARKRSRR